MTERPWATTEAEQLIARGHAAGDILEAHDWRVLEQEHGLLVVSAHLPAHLLNPHGQLFGGFTPTYVDMVSLFTVHTTDPDRDPKAPRRWLSTINMRCDYFEPITGPTFTIRGEVENQRGTISLVSAKFFQDDKMAAHAITTIRSTPNNGPGISA